MPSFDIVSEVNHVEIRNAVDQANKEIANRFDFKGSDARVEINDKETSVTVFADDEFKLRQVRDVSRAELIQHYGIHRVAVFLEDVVENAPVGAAGELDAVHRVLTLHEISDGAVHGPHASPSGQDQRAINIEQDEIHYATEEL